MPRLLRCWWKVAPPLPDNSTDDQTSSQDNQLTNQHEENAMFGTHDVAITLNNGETITARTNGRIADIVAYYLGDGYNMGRAAGAPGRVSSVVVDGCVF